MPLSGEAIRTMNYVDDISVTLRRILSVLPMLSAEERERVAAHIQQAEPSYESVVKDLASCTYRADRCVALEGLQDDARSVVSVIRGRKTTAAAEAAVCSWLQRLECRTVVVEDAHPAMPGVL